MKSPIEEYMRTHLSLARALIEGAPPTVTVPELERQLKRLAKEYGEGGYRQIVHRAAAAVSELFGGEPAPPLARLSADGITAVEADITAEQLVAEFRKSGACKASGPEWGEDLDRSYNAYVDGYHQDLERRRAAAATRAAEAQPPAVPAPTEELVHVTVPAEVEPVQTRAAVEEIAQLREELSELRKIATRAASGWKGVWSPAQDYARGQLVTCGGTLWHCNADGTTEKPGTGASWSLMVKNSR